MKGSGLTVAIYGTTFRAIYDDLLSKLQDVTERLPVIDEVDTIKDTSNQLTLIALENEINEKISN